MPTIQQTHLITEEEYLNDELTSDKKREYVNGHVFAITGASKNHERIATNIQRRFGNHLENSSCETFGSDLKIKTPSGSFRYPDCMVVCKDNSESEYYTTSPVIIVEVLSRTTRKTDERTKLIEYINIPSLKEYAIIEQDFADITVYRKSNDWRCSHYFLAEEIFFESINCTLAVEDIYHRVQNADMNDFLNNTQ